ncbi:MAG: SHOCT domain-containing protein [Ignavibacteriae bacterium]|nr:SHOCT domain-containing protein [Ignavibacteriota bacterium]
MMGGGGFMLLGSVILLVLIGLIVWMVWTIANGNGVRNNIGDESTQEILKKRYARGEITKEQFDDMKKNIT